MEEQAGTDDERGLVARRIMGHAVGRSDDFLIWLLRERLVRDVSIEELQRIAAELDAERAARVAELQRFFDHLPAVDA